MGLSNKKAFIEVNNYLTEVEETKFCYIVIRKIVRESESV